MFILVSEADFTERVVAHETTLVNIAVDTDYATFRSILPHGIVAIVSQHGSIVSIHGDHQLIVVNLTLKMLVIEIAEGIE